MKLTSNSFPNGGIVPGRCAFGIKAPKGHLRLSDNLSPELTWSGAPSSSQTLILICTDPDVPSKPDDVNQEGREVPLKLARTTFVHWVMVDIPINVGHLAEGACSRGITARGKKSPPGPEGARQGLNSYTDWFSGDDEMGGEYFGYDGPCPPWNDSVVHHYQFEIIATDLNRCPVEGSFTEQEVRKAISGHVLASARLVGRYSLNPRIRLS